MSSSRWPEVVLSTFPVSLNGFIFIHGARQAGDQVTGEGQRLAGLRFVVLDGLPGERNIHLQQGVHAMLPRLHHTPCALNSSIAPL
jgi:hypothetical protein